MSHSYAQRPLPKRVHTCFIYRNTADWRLALQSEHLLRKIRSRAEHHFFRVDMYNLKPERLTLREAQRELTRDQIMAGARACFLRNTYTEVSVEEIVAEARVSRATFYNHFPDKKSLVAEMIDHFLHPIGETYHLLLLNPPEDSGEVADWVEMTFKSREKLKDDIRIAQQAGILDPSLGEQFFNAFGEVVEVLVPLVMMRRPQANRKQIHMRLWIACRAIDTMTTEIVVARRPLDRMTAIAELTHLWCNALAIPIRHA